MLQKLPEVPFRCCWRIIKKTLHGEETANVLTSLCLAHPWDDIGGLSVRLYLACP
jgi:hypothetical protein